MERKRPRRTRERILESALRLFNAHGEPNVTTNAIADALDISPGNLYYHFRSKEAIVAALFDAYAQDIDRLLDVPQRPSDTAFEDAWLFLHLLFEAIWRHRFIYRDLNDLLSRHRRLEAHFRTILERKVGVAKALCAALADHRRLAAHPRELDALATNMVVVATWWLPYESVANARRLDDPAGQSAAVARGAFQVLSLVAPYLGERDHALFTRLAGEYLKT